MEIKFGSVLKQLRRRSEVSQRELAEAIGVDFSYISKLENDRLPPPAADTIVRICERLKVPSEDLLMLSKKIPTDIRETVVGSASALNFLRQAGEMNLTDSEWGLLQQRLRRLRRRR